ncbi:DUF2304 family protein [Candidatus Falkowbacteria bacterium]|nr:DUF2304 family protein [Candidatus Falkowbacteria bacterium]
MLIQQIIAIIIILVIFLSVFLKFRRKQISGGEFFVWSVFWILVALAMIFIKKIDGYVLGLGIASRGIDVLIYVAVPLIFYLIFRIYVRLEKMERNITKVTRQEALGTTRHEARGKRHEGDEGDEV